MESDNRIENVDVFRKVLAEYTSLCRIAPYIRLRNDEQREITSADYCISLPYQENGMQGFVLYVEMRSKAFDLFIARYQRVEKENDVLLHVRSVDNGIIELDGYVINIFVQYLIFREDNL